ncbi:MAG: GTP cyclohydrolase [Capnocytophaga sp.]|nr:GTP cyclohydrolase [Capnocytophaga sp.]
MITIKEMHSKKEIRDFVKFPFSLYKNHPYWVPPIIDEEAASFDKTKNPVFDNADAFLYMAFNGNKPVGRIAAIINKHDLNDPKTRKIRFGWLDMVDDIEVTKALLAKVAEIGREHGLDYMEGPIGFSNMDKVGVLTDGYDHIGNMMTWYSHPYYNKHLKKLGMSKEKGYVETYFLVENVNYEVFHRTAEAVRKRYGVKMLDTKTTKDILPHVDEMFALFNKSYASLASFVPITKRQIDFFKKKYIPFVNPEYVRFIADAEGKIVCFAIVLPSFSKALQKANGKLFPFGFWHLLNARKKNDTVEFYLIGVSPEYQSKGVPALLFDYYYPTFKRDGILKCISTPELEDNLAIQQLWKNFKPVDFAHRVTYRKEL